MQDVLAQCLQDLVVHAVLVLPEETGRATVELTHKRKGLVTCVLIECADAVNRQNIQDLHQSKPAPHQRCTRIRINAHWKRDVAASMWWPISCAQVLHTSENITDKRFLSRLLQVFGGQPLALTKSGAISNKRSLSLSLCNRTRRCSAVIPDDPPVALLAVRKLTMNQSRSKEGSTSVCPITSGRMGTLA